MAMKDLLKSPIDDVLAQLNTSLSGLTSEEVDKRLKYYGYNELAKRKKRIAIAEFIYQFRSPLLIILLIASLISFFFGEFIDASIIFTIVIISVVLNYYQESKAEKAAEMLKGKVTTTSTVLRDGAKKEINISEIVPGDILFFSAGDIISADSRIIEERGLFVNQSTLTGESFPIEKSIEHLQAKSLAINEWTNYLFMGTSVISGSAMAVVLKTGAATEYGKIAKRLLEKQPETEFESGLRRFGLFIMEITFILVIFVFFINALIQHDILQSLLFAVALAVGLTPEFLPLIVTINLSKSALYMSKKGVIVKRLGAIQNFGSMDVLCSDKTGTLTENKIALVRHIDIEEKDDEKVLFYSYINSYYQAGMKSPLDEAILNFKNINIEKFQKIDEIPFDFFRKKISVIVNYEGKRFIITKGAPEDIKKVCSYFELNGEILNLTKDFQTKIEQKYNDLSSNGLRVLGISYKKIGDQPDYTINDESEMILLGFVAFIDPPKETIKESLQLLKKAGIEVKIITGDNDLVTRKVCEKLNFEIKGVVLGSEIEQLHDDALAKKVEDANIFTRVTPLLKEKIVHVLKENGHVVGFLGDGINDAPSIKTADIGITVDNAVDVAKESADIILLRKDLKILYDGVIDGRKTYGNTMKYIMMGISSNFGTMISVAAASLFLPFIPMLPTQILLNNLLYDLSETTLPTDNIDSEYVQKPKKLEIPFIRKFMLIFGPLSSIFDFITFFLLLVVFNADESLFQTFWFVESFCHQTLIVFVIRTRITPFYKSKPSRPLLFGSLIVIAIAIILPFTPIGPLFGFVQLPLPFFIIMIILIISYITLVEIVKKWFYKLEKN